MRCRKGESAASHRCVLAELMAHSEEIEQRIGRFKQRPLDGLVDEANHRALLQILPGVGRIVVALLLVGIGTEISAFGSAARLASWIGICPGNHESAGKRQSGWMRPGNPDVRRMLCDFPDAASCTVTVFRSKLRALVIPRGYERPIVAIADDLLRWIFIILLRHQPYREQATDRLRSPGGTTQCRAPRWIKALTKFGYLTPAHA